MGFKNLVLKAIEELSIDDVESIPRSTGFLIAASDSLRLHKRQAHIVCDGVNDEVQINDAISLYGGCVTLLPGIYTVAESGTTAGGDAFCIVLNRENVKLQFLPGAVVKSAVGNGAFLVYVGEGNYVSGPLPTLKRNIQVVGPGTLDANLETCGGLNARGFLADVVIGGGLRIMGCRGTAVAQLPFTLSGVGVGGQPFGSFFGDRWTVDHVYVTDCDEGGFATGTRGLTIDRLFIDGINSQDAFEPIGNIDLVMTRSILKNSQGSALDIFSSSTVAATYERQTYVDCVFGPSTGNVVAIGVGGHSSQTFRNIKLVSCHIILANANVGVAIATIPGGSKAVGTELIGCTIDGRNAVAGADGVTIGVDATRSFILSNQISDCPGAAIDRTANPVDLQIRNNGGYNNGSGISAGSGLQNRVTDNDFDADT